MTRTRTIALLLGMLLSTTGLYLLNRNADSVLDSVSHVLRKTGGEGILSVWTGHEDLDEPPKAPPYGAVVAAGRSTDDLQWLNFFVKDWMIYPYNVDIPNNPDPRLQIPENKGHEAMVYLSYIISNYDTLSWMTVFTHGHTEAWHQEEHIVRLISSLNRTALAREEYISLRCDWYPTCPAEIKPKAHDAKVWGPGVMRKQTEAAIEGNWRMLFPGEQLPDTIASQCCAQFAVTRRAVLRRPLVDYERMRDWLLHSLTVDDVSGRVFEKLWAYIFTGQAVQWVTPSIEREDMTLTVF